MTTETPITRATSTWVIPWMDHVERLSLGLGQVLDGGKHPAAVGGDPGAAAGRRRHEPLAQLDGGGLFI